VHNLAKQGDLSSPSPFGPRPSRRGVL